MVDQNQAGLQRLSPFLSSVERSWLLLTVVVIFHLPNGSQEIKRSKSLGDGLPQSRQRREERWRRRVSGFIQSAVGALKPEPAVESSQVSVTALPCNQIRPGQTTTAAMYASHSTMQWSHVSQQI